METGPSVVKHPGIWSPVGWGPLLPCGALLCSGVILGRGRASLWDARAAGLGARAGDGHGASALDADVGNNADFVFGWRLAVHIPLCSSSHWGGGRKAAPVPQRGVLQGGWEPTARVLLGMQRGAPTLFHLCVSVCFTLA